MLVAKAIRPLAPRARRKDLVQGLPKPTLSHRIAMHGRKPCRADGSCRTSWRLVSDGNAPPACCAAFQDARRRPGTAFASRASEGEAESGHETTMAILWKGSASS